MTIPSTSSQKFLWKKTLLRLKLYLPMLVESPKIIKNDDVEANFAHAQYFMLETKTTVDPFCFKFLHLSQLVLALFYIWNLKTLHG